MGRRARPVCGCPDTRSVQRLCGGWAHCPYAPAALFQDRLQLAACLTVTSHCAALAEGLAAAHMTFNLCCCPRARAVPGTCFSGDRAHVRRQAAELAGTATPLPLRPRSPGRLLRRAWASAGLVKGSPALAFLQWLGRSNVLFLVLHSVPEVRRAQRLRSRAPGRGASLRGGPAALPAPQGAAARRRSAPDGAAVARSCGRTGRCRSCSYAGRWRTSCDTPGAAAAGCAPAASRRSCAPHDPRVSGRYALSLAGRPPALLTWLRRAPRLPLPPPWPARSAFGCGCTRADRTILQISAYHSP